MKKHKHNFFYIGAILVMLALVGVFSFKNGSRLYFFKNKVSGVTTQK